MAIGVHETLAERFCRHYAVAPEGFEPALIERTLNPHARALQRLLQLMPRDYFASEIELARRIGAIKTPSELEAVIVAFHAHPVSRRALSRGLRVRMSLSRLRRLVGQIFVGSVHGSARLSAA
jgi:hypothetical protein